MAGSVSRRFLIASSLQFDVNKLAEKLTVQQLLDDDAETADADSAAFGPLVPLGRWLSIVSSHKLPPQKKNPRIITRSSSLPTQWRVPT